jgi:hypothetical protein
MPAFLMLKRQQVRRIIRRVSAALRLSVVLSLWHAPIPWIHAHDLEGPEVDRLPLLARHVNEFHGREVTRGQHHLDWHLHLVLPWSLVHDTSCPEDGHPQPGSDEYCGAPRLAVASAAPFQGLGELTARALLPGQLSADLAIITPSEVGAQAALTGCARGTHFFATYGRADAVRDLLGVRLC